ncbi:MAG: T9SS type A sorting domain-containing protein, partial [Prevotellaceae bacterium]|nr:T9SS type A sorting domain-containing protein [Prevotellaceae bacterium]
VYFGVKSPADTSTGQTNGQEWVSLSKNSGKLLLSFAGQADSDLNISLFSSSGALLYREKIPASNNHIEISVAHLPAGVFLCSVSTGLRNKIFKWIH